MVDKKPKSPTEPFNIGDAWDGFRSTYLPFVEWMRLPEPDEETSICLIEFIDDEPTNYTNKWSREQFKMKVKQDYTDKILSAGKRLFSIIRDFCMAERKLPHDLGLIQISRWGSGFDIQYSIEYPIKK